MSKQTEKIKELVEKREQACLGGGQKAIDKQHARGKYTARERIDMLVDKGSFEEYDMFKLLHSQWWLFVRDYGSEDLQGDGHGHDQWSSCHLHERLRWRTYSGGYFRLGRIWRDFRTQHISFWCHPADQCDHGSLRRWCRLFTCIDRFHRDDRRNQLYVPIDAEHLGGASVHAGKSGVTSFTAKTEEDAMQQIRTLLSYIPSNNSEEAPRVECTDPIDRKEDLLNDILPDDPNKAYDMYKVIKAITDNGDFFEVQPKFAKNIITGFARFNGQSVGIVANQPAAYAGVLDVNASRKGARFVRFCDAFNIPIVSLVDVPGFLPGTGQEYNAVILHGAQLLFAYGEATVPKITINLRKSYGGSHIVMGCK